MARPRKPTALLEATGAFKKDPKRGRERGNEPQFAKGAECPKHLKGIARERWNFLADQMDAVGMLQNVDAMALEAACVAYAQAVQADQEIEKHGLVYTITTESGDVIPRKRPEVEVSNAAWGRYKAFCTEFGLTPASRSRLGVGKSEKPQTMDDILGDAAPIIRDLSALQ